ncbi:RsfA family transcriptional regulator [Salipaludibacillus daqingensis]|uniref:RsfA family transcriptional regulator n=1 Tax=Salipaludibacillus daqingensis TaxID=3041001 RepID=UPI00247457FB|nr:RsfA family transcriptional regulator [Salipaludibacillus daqingensis]
MKVRQDAWSHEDDLLLAETVLRHIREGSTQLNAFDEVGDALNRTSAACGFRWNAVVRDKYDEAIKLAKKHRKQRKRRLAQESKPNVYKQYQPKVEATPSMIEEFSHEVAPAEPVARQEYNRKDDFKNDLTNDMTIEKVISFLRNMQGNGSKETMLENENQELKRKVHELESAYSQLEKQYQGIEEDYQSIIKIMDRARKMAILEEDPEEKHAAAFRMDKNGNLEKVAK